MRTNLYPRLPLPPFVSQFVSEPAPRHSRNRRTLELPPLTQRPHEEGTHRLADQGSPFVGPCVAGPTDPVPPVVIVGAAAVQLARNAQFGVVTPVRPVRATSSSSTGSRMLAGYRRTASDRGRGQARPFGLSDLAAGLATCHPGRHFIITPLFSPRKTARNCDNQDSKSESNQLTLEKAPASLS